MSKVVYLIEQPLDQRNYERFGIQVWLDRGWEVEVWDLTPWAHPKVWKNFVTSGRELATFDRHFQIKSTRDLKLRYAAMGKVGHFVDDTGDSLCSVQPKWHLSRSGAVRVICAIGSAPEPRSDKPDRLLRRLFTLVRRNPLEIFSRISESVVGKLTAKFARPSLVVVSGRESSRRAKEAGYVKEILEAHNLDYDIYLSIKDAAATPQGNYAVFIDQNLCFHSDFIYLNRPAYVTKGKYFSTVCKGLKAISDVLKVDIRIAMHPRSPVSGDFAANFEGFPLEHGRTAELIRDCKVVVCHYSTSIQIAVLFEKPIIFVTTDELQASPGGEFVDRCAEVLGKTAINLDKDLSIQSWDKEILIDKERYSDFRREYIKNDGSSQRSHWNIVIDQIEKDKQAKEI